jgi:hypothetical protein
MKLWGFHFPLFFPKASIFEFVLLSLFDLLVVCKCGDLPCFDLFFSFLFFCNNKELASIDDEALLSCIQDVLDERVKPVKGKIGMQRQRFRSVKTGVDLMLDVCRRTHSDLETEMEGKCKFHPTRAH